jgi:hypothetical protein
MLRYVAPICSLPMLLVISAIILGLLAALWLPVAVR